MLHQIAFKFRKMVGLNQTMQYGDRRIKLPPDHMLFNHTKQFVNYDQFIPW